MNTLDPSRNVRANIAAQLARYLSELSGAGSPQPQPFSISRALHQMYSDGGLRSGPEYDLAQQLAEENGQPFDQNRVHIPWATVGLRDMTAAGVSGSQYLVGTDTLPTANVLNGASLAQESGATIITGLTGNAAMPRISARPITYWLADENTQITETQPTVGVGAAMPKSVACLVDGTRLLRVQSPEVVDVVIEREFAAAAWLAIDTAIVAGTGASGEPQGLASLLTPTSGTSLTYASVCDMLKSVRAGGGRNASFWAGPAAEKILRTRERFTGAGAIWGDNGIGGERSVGTPAVSDTSLLVGDFTDLYVLIWGHPKLELNPYGDFARGMWQARLIVQCDFLIGHPGSFAIATSIT
jgi:hypothetical protein